MIKVFKMLSGEDIICDMREETDSSVVIKNPACIIIQTLGDGRVGASFSPYSPYAKDGIIKLYKSAICGEIEVDVKLENEYNRIFGSGIVVAAADSLRNYSVN